MCPDEQHTTNQDTTGENLSGTHFYTFLEIDCIYCLQSMGGKELEEDAASILNQLQSTLNGVLDQLAHKFAER